MVVLSNIEFTTKPNPIQFKTDFGDFFTFAAKQASLVVETRFDGIQTNNRIIHVGHSRLKALVEFVMLIDQEFDSRVVVLHELKQFGIDIHGITSNETDHVVEKIQKEGRVLRIGGKHVVAELSFDGCDEVGEEQVAEIAVDIAW